MQIYGPTFYRSLAQEEIVILIFAETKADQDHAMVPLTYPESVPQVLLSHSPMSFIGVNVNRMTTTVN